MSGAGPKFAQSFLKANQYVEGALEGVKVSTVGLYPTAQAFSTLCESAQSYNWRARKGAAVVLGNRFGLHDGAQASVRYLLEHLLETPTQKWGTLLEEHSIFYFTLSASSR